MLLKMFFEWTYLKKKKKKKSLFYKLINVMMLNEWKRF